MSNLTLVINTSHAAKVVEISYLGLKDSINLMPNSRAYLPDGAEVIPNYATTHANHLKIYLPKTAMQQQPKLLVADDTDNSTPSK